MLATVELTVDTSEGELLNMNFIETHMDVDQDVIFGPP